MGIHARSPVNLSHITFRTPPEIFGIIFSHVTEGDLFQASQVCQYWRSVLTSFASLWTRISTAYGPQAIASLERCGPLPIRLRIDEPFPSRVLEKVLFLGNKIASLNAMLLAPQISRLQQLLELSRPSMERLIFQCYAGYFRRNEDQTMRDIEQDFPRLRELFIAEHSISIHKLTAPNLVHLVLEHTGRKQNVTVQTILDMLRRFPLLETLLLNYEEDVHHAPAHCDSVRLPHLRSIEVGPWEVHSGLITNLDFPPDVAVGFQSIYQGDLLDPVPDMLLDSMRHVLKRVKIRSITLAEYHWDAYFLIRYEGLRGYLEITASLNMYLHPKDSMDYLFGARGLLLSSSPHIEDVTEMHIVGCIFKTHRGLEHVKETMQNVDAISFFRCEGAHPFVLLTSENTSSPPFPRLERVMVLGDELGLEEMAKNRRDLGVPLKTLILGRDQEDFKHDRLEDYATLEGLVGDLRIDCPVEIVEWGARNEIVDVWSAAGASDPVSLNRAH